MSQYETPTSIVTKSKRRFESRQKSRKSKHPKENPDNWKLAKFVPELRKK